MGVFNESAMWRFIDRGLHHESKQMEKWGRMARRGVDGGAGRKRKVCILGQTNCETIRVQKR